ncbi:hypothetical protein DL95DRAFT_394841, partial [Leptodontidium sp. 2 PMI_412]
MGVMEMMDVDSVPWRSKEVENTNHENMERIRNTRLADADGNGDEDEDVNMDKPCIKEDQPPAPSTVPVDPNTEAVTHLVALIKRIQDQAHAQEYEQEYEHLHSHPHWLEMSNVEQKDSTTKSTRSAASVSTAIPISPINLLLDDTPRAVLYSNTNPSAQIWARNFTKGCTFMSYCRPLEALQCRLVDSYSPLEAFLERGGGGDRNTWRLSSTLVDFSSQEDGSWSEKLRGGVVYHDNITAEGEAPGRFLSGELISAIAFITRQILSPQQTPKRHMVRGEYV